MNQCSPFVRKAYQIVSDNSTNEIVSWSEDGKSFTIHDPHRFEQSILPNYFKHNNLCSFVRQLNTYGFRKITTDILSGGQEFAHESFQRDYPDVLSEVVRRANVRTRQRERSTSPGSEETANPVLLETLFDLMKRQQQSDQLLASVARELEETKRILQTLQQSPQGALNSTRNPFVGKRYFYQSQVPQYTPSGNMQQTNIQPNRLPTGPPTVAPDALQHHQQTAYHSPLDNLGYYDSSNTTTDIQEIMQQL